VAAAVRSTGEPTPVSIKSVLLNSSQGVRTNFRFRVILNDGSTSVDMADVGWDQYVRRILIEETIRGPDRLILTMQNPIGDDAETHLFSDATLLSEGSTAQVSIGWEETDLVDHGTFYLSRPRQTYSGSDSIKVIGYSGEVLLSREGAKRRFYEKKTDSQLAHEIAAKYGHRRYVR